MDKIVRAVPQEMVKQAGQEEEVAAPKAAPRFIGKAQSHDSYDLEYPMEYDGVEYRTVTFSRLKGKHFNKMRLMLQTGANPDIALASLVTDVPVEVLEEMDSEDFMTVAERSKTFIPARFLNPESGQD